MKAIDIVQINVIIAKQIQIKRLPVNHAPTSSANAANPAITSARNLKCTGASVASGNSGVHQLAASLLNNQLGYPTVVFLDEEFRIIQPLSGYQKAEEFHKIIQFIGQDHYKDTKWDQWQTTYKSPYKGE